MAERIFSTSKILEKQACFFDKAVAMGLHDPKPENVSQESWDKKLNFSAALLHGANAGDIAGNYGNNVNYVKTSVREVLSACTGRLLQNFARANPWQHCLMQNKP